MNSEMIIYVINLDKDWLFSKNSNTDSLESPHSLTPPLGRDYPGTLPISFNNLLYFLFVLWCKIG